MAIHRLIATGLGLSALLAVGCVEEHDPCGQLRTEEPTLQLGTGNVEYETIEDGDMLGAHYGPQGGYHVYGSILASSLYPGAQQEIERYFGNTGTDSAGLDRLNPVASYTVTTQEGDVVAERELQAPLLPQDQMLTRQGDIVFFPVGADPVPGAVVDFQMTIVDLCGQTTTDEVDDLTLFIQTPPP